MKNNESLNCLLCGSDKIIIHQSLSSEDILRCWEANGVKFSPQTIQPLSQALLIHLYRCLNCGFQFFDPKLAGNAQFYQELHAQGEGYYAPDRPENERNARYALAQGYRSILDIGCGSGFALDAARRAGLNTFGIELSQTAAAEATKRGHTIFPVLLENMDSKWEGKFDLISLNQVLEHVPDPVGVVRQCVRFLSPRGAIAIAVPSASGVLRFTPWLPANWPPHHLSRWRLDDFWTLGQQTKLNVIKTGGNRLLGTELAMNLLEHRKFCQVLQKPARGLPPYIIKAICLLYRKTGLKYIFNRRGHSIYCYLARPAEPNQS